MNKDVINIKTKFIVVFVVLTIGFGYILLGNDFKTEFIRGGVGAVSPDKKWEFGASHGIYIKNSKGKKEYYSEIEIKNLAKKKVELVLYIKNLGGLRQGGRVFWNSNSEIVTLYSPIGKSVKVFKYNTKHGRFSFYNVSRKEFEEVQQKNKN